MRALDFYNAFVVDGRAVIRGAIDSHGEQHPLRWLACVDGQMMLCECRSAAGCRPVSNLYAINADAPIWKRQPTVGRPSLATVAATAGVA